MIQYQKDNLWVFESALFRTTTTLISTEDCIILVDPNWLPEEIAAIKKQLNQVREAKDLYLLFTHSDYDHIIAYAAFEDATVIASKAFSENPDREKILQQIQDFDDAYYVERDYPIVYPDVDILIAEDGQQLKIGNTRLHFYLAPGHNRDGIFTIVENLGIWIVGDYLSNIEFPYLYHSYADYLRTLAKVDRILADHRINYLIPGHGDIAFDAVEIQKRKSDSIQYLEACKRSIEKGEDFDLQQLWKRYKFPKIMTEFHQANIKLIKKELGG